MEVFETNYIVEQILGFSFGEETHSLFLGGDLEREVAGGLYNSDVIDVDFQRRSANIVFEGIEIQHEEFPEKRKELQRGKTGRRVFRALWMEGKNGHESKFLPTLLLDHRLGQYSGRFPDLNPTQFICHGELLVSLLQSFVELAEIPSLRVAYYKMQFKLVFFECHFFDQKSRVVFLPTLLSLSIAYRHFLAELTVFEPLRDLQIHSLDFYFTTLHYNLFN